MPPSTPRDRRTFLYGLILGALLMLALNWSQPGFSAFLFTGGPSSRFAPDLALLGQVGRIIEDVYVDRAAVQPEKLTYGAIGGMVEALGDTGHSAFLSPEMVKQEEEFTKGSYKGIGAEVKVKDGHVVIVAPFDGSPAQKAGLRPGEIILRVDGQDVAGLPLIQVVRRIAGEAGTRVTLTILNPASEATRDVLLTRTTIAIHHVTWQQLPGTKLAHLRLAGFSEGVTDDLDRALRAIRGKGLAGIILDLRDNPGGLLNEAVGAASQFLAGGTVLQEKDAKGEITSVPVRSGGLATEIPLVVLVNGGTASAAEILSGALQDAGRAELVGEKTFGTGTVLQRFPLPDGSALLLAVEEWLTPKGRVIWHQGIAPDRVVALPEGVQPLIPLLEDGLTAEGLSGSWDRQLLTALKMLEEKPR